MTLKAEQTAGQANSIEAFTKRRKAIAILLKKFHIHRAEPHLFWLFVYMTAYKDVPTPIKKATAYTV